MKSILTACLLVVSFSFSAKASEEKEYLDFFTQYQALSDAFDVSVAEMYSDDARILVLQKLPDGTQRTMEIAGQKYKTMLVDAMDVARKRGDQSKFSDIQITLDGATAKIKASRYAVVKCFQDTRYYMLAKKQSDGKIQIIEEFVQSPMESNCESRPENDLALLLEATAKMMNKDLPVMADASTKLEKVSVTGNEMKFHYELVDFISSDVDKDVILSNMKPAIAQQSCVTPSLRAVMDQGGTITYLYNGNDKKEIATFSVGKDSCS